MHSVYGSFTEAGGHRVASMLRAPVFSLLAFIIQLSSFCQDQNPFGETLTQIEQT